MSPQDSQLLQDFLSQLVQAHGVPKDPEAEAMISKAVAQQPDAAYLLVQRSLLQQLALDNAKAEIAALQNQLRGAPHAAPAFLDPNAWGGDSASRPSTNAQSVPVAPANYPPPSQQPPQPQAPGSGGFLRGGMGSALGNIASTAAGVAAGGFLFQGLERLLGNHAGSGIVGNQNPFSSLTQPLEKITANNYIEGETASEAADYQDNQDSNEDVDTPYDDTGSDDDDMFT